MLRRSLASVHVDLDRHLSSGSAEAESGEDRDKGGLFW